MKRKKQFLFCPGPVNISLNVKEAVHNEIGHREVEFSKLVKSINSKLLKLYEIKNTKLYHPVLITGSGTAANESVLSSVVGKSNILIISNGEFGERLYEISTIHNPTNTKLLKFGWGQRFDFKKIEEFIKQNDIRLLAMVHHETSTGMLNPIKEIGKIAKRNNVLFIVDTVSSIGAEKIDIEESNIAFCIGTASKAIGSLPGVAFVIGEKKEFKKLKNLPAKTAYLNLYKFYHYSTKFAQTPNTPAVQLFFSFEQALNNIHKEGIEKRRQHIKNMTQALRKGLKDMGLSFVIDELDMSSVLTTVNTPDYIDFETLKKKLREKSIIIYNGKGPLHNRVFQVGNIGAIDQESVEFFLSSLKNILSQIKENEKIKISLPETHQLQNANQIIGAL